MNKKLMEKLGIREEDTKPKDQINELENAIIEIAEISANNEVSIEDLTEAILELAKLIGG